MNSHRASIDKAIANTIQQDTPNGTAASTATATPAYNAMTGTEPEEPKNVYYLDSAGIVGAAAAVRKHQSLKTRNKLFVPLDLLMNSQ
jgi:hypothetical protein